MFCTKCGNQIENNSINDLNSNDVVKNLENGTQNPPLDEGSSKKKKPALLLWLVGGFLGLHRFYLGYRKSAKAMLLMNVLIIMVAVSFLIFNRSGSHILGFALVELFVVLSFIIWIWVDFVKILSGSLLKNNITLCSSCSSSNNKFYRKVSSFLLCIWAGYFGIHRFYMGHKKSAIFMLLLMLYIIVSSLLYFISVLGFSFIGTLPNYLSNINRVCHTFLYVWVFIDAVLILLNKLSYEKSCMAFRFFPEK